MKISCSNEERLVDYLEGRLPEEDSFEMEQHLAECQTCLEALVVTNGMMRGSGRFELNPVPEEVTEAAVRLVTSRHALSYRSLMKVLKRSISDFGSRISDILSPKPLRRWQLAPVRGTKIEVSEDLVYLAVPFKEIKTEIEIEKSGTGKARIRVKLQEANKHRKTLRVTLKRNEREIASYILEDPYVVFEDIPFGHYSISLAESGLNLGAYFFELKETRHGGKYDQ